MNITRLWGALGVCLSVFLSTVSAIAEGALLPRLGGLAVYDTDRDITWIANANLAVTNQFGLTLSINVHDDTPNTVGSTGRMTWDNAQAWIAGMNAANYLGFNNWRLPDTLQPDPSCDSQSNPGGGFPLQGYGYNCTGSEMGHLFYEEFGATAGTSVLTGDPVELAKFTNLQPDFYWSGLEYAPNTYLVWDFYFHNGYQNADLKSLDFYVWAVRPGDVVVPVPAAVWLFGSGLMGLLGVGLSRRPG